jgi:tRNA threonylcarbamoyladenosine biosynthesis protein TsaB
VCSLETLASFAAKNVKNFNGVKDDSPILFCPMIDARRMEVYTALYNSTGEEIRPVSAEIIEENFLSDLFETHKIMFFGNGAEKCKSHIKHKNAVFEGPLATSAEYMQLIAEKKFSKNQFEDIAYFEPFYLKNFVATIPRNKVF